MMAETLGVALYARATPQEQTTDGCSIEAQLDTLRNYCALHGRAVVDEYVDCGLSGTTIEGRPELRRMLDEAQVGKFGEVLVVRVSRLSERQTDLLQLFRQLGERGVGFESVTEKFDTRTQTGKVLLQMMDAMQQLDPCRVDIESLAEKFKTHSTMDRFVLEMIDTLRPLHGSGV